MRKFQVVALALFAMFAFSAAFAVSASAETTLLAEWLVNGAKIVGELASETTGSLKLEDTKTAIGAAAVLCSAIADGTVGENGLDLIKEILNLAKEKIEALGGLALLGTGAGSDCVRVTGCEEGTATEPIEVWPVGLEWHTELFLMENGEILDLVNKEDGSVFGYELLCSVLLINTEDTCTATDSEFAVINDADTGDAAVPAGSIGLPLANCTLGGLETGVNETDELAPITLTSGELLTVSSE
jgi:hypothetical protein